MLTSLWVLLLQTVWMWTQPDSCKIIYTVKAIFTTVEDKRVFQEMKAQSKEVH